MIESILFSSAFQVLVAFAILLGLPLAAAWDAWRRRRRWRA